MKSTTSTERLKKALYISLGVTFVITLLFISYLFAALNKFERVREVYGIRRDSTILTSSVSPKDSVAATACIDTLENVSGVIERQGVLDNVIMPNIDKTLENIAFFETITYFCLILCAGVLLFYLFAYFYKKFLSRRKSSLTELPKQKAMLFAEDLQDPVGLDKLISQRIQQAKNKEDKSDRFALDHIYLSRAGLLKPRIKLAYQEAYLNDIIGNSQFSGKVREIEEILDNEKITDPLNYRGRLMKLDEVFERFTVIRKKLTSCKAGNFPENDRKIE